MAFPPREARLSAPRLARELRTIAAMMRIACRDRHGAAARDAGGLCADCAGLLAYARQRLANCPFGPDKPTCAHCPVHCYGKRQREAVRALMRYAGPRMPMRHPWLAIAHLIDGRRPVPPHPAARRAAAAMAAAENAAAAAAANAPAAAADAASAPATPHARRGS